MAKKLMFVGEFPDDRVRLALATLCGISLAKFDGLFDYGTLFNKEVKWFPRDAALRADALLKETVHPVLVLCGPRVAEAFGVAAQSFSEPFALGVEEIEELASGNDKQTEQVRLVIKVLPFPNDKFYKRRGKRVLTKSLMQGLVAMNQQPVTPEEALAACDIVRKALGEDMDLITKLHVEAIEKDLKAGKVVDNSDLRRLMVEYARNVKLWVNPNDEV